MPRRVRSSPSTYLFGLLVLVGLIVTLVKSAPLLVFFIVAAYIGFQIFQWNAKQTAERLEQQQLQEIAQSQYESRLNTLLSKLIQKSKGRVTLLEFSLQANLSAAEAKQYLDHKSLEFNAHFDATDAGNLVYIFDLAEQDEVAQANYSRPLNQTELANRLRVATTTISRRRLDSEFPSWSQDKDPDDIAWTYSTETKLFHPS